MRRITLLLMLMATVLLVASGVAWAVTKTCPPNLNRCVGTSGADVLKSTSQGSFMEGKGGNDTYWVRGIPGKVGILDSGGRDQLWLSHYRQSEVRSAPADVNKNGKADALLILLGKGTQNYVLIGGYFDDTRSKPPYNRGFGYIEVFKWACSFGGCTAGPDLPLP